MTTSTMYLDKAMEVGARELNALLQGDAELALVLFEQRSQLMSQAWSIRVDSDNDLYYRKLQEVQELQELLSTEARRQRDSIREGLMHSRKESVRLAGYKQAVSYAVM